MRGGWARLSRPETWATGVAHSSVVSATPTRGSANLTRETTPGSSSLASTPTTVGTSTTWKVLTARPCTCNSQAAGWLSRTAALEAGGPRRPPPPPPNRGRGLRA